jgi:hypothetical protein
MIGKYDYLRDNQILSSSNKSCVGGMEMVEKTQQSGRLISFEDVMAFK